MQEQRRRHSFYAATIQRPGGIDHEINAAVLRGSAKREVTAE